MNTYTFRNRMGSDEQAQAVGEMLEDLEDKSAQGLVAAAKKRSNPAHDMFEWDDKRAAIEHRLVQARVIIRSLDVDVTDIEKQKHYIAPAFPRSAKVEGNYVPYEESTSEERDDLVQEFLTLINRMQRRFKDVKEANLVIEAIDETKRHLTRRRKKAAGK